MAVNKYNKYRQNDLSLYLAKGKLVHQDGISRRDRVRVFVEDVRTIGRRSEQSEDRMPLGAVANGDWG